jgi:membrane protease YdiL (CAAX protease family)
MTALPLTPPTSPTTASRPVHPVRAFVARHPVGTMVTAMLGIDFAVLIPPARAGLPVEPFLLVVVLFAQLLPAVLVAAAVDGRAGVRELFGRVFRWRVRPSNWLLALLVIPVGSVLLAAAVFGPDTVRAAGTDPAIALAYLGSLTILPIVNLWEETAVAGTIQARLSDRHGMLIGALLTAPVFTLQHLPLHVAESFSTAAVSMLALGALAVPFRIVIGWLYERTGRSILVVAALHATFNATNGSALFQPAGGHYPMLLPLASWVVVGGWGLWITVRRLRRDRADRSA